MSARKSSVNISVFGPQKLVGFSVCSGLEIDTQHLREQGAPLQTRMEKIIQSLRSQQQQPQENGVQDADWIRDGVMY